MPLTVPYPLYDITSLFISLRNDGNYDGLRGLAHNFAAQHWSAFLEMLDAALGPNQQ